MGVVNVTPDSFYDGGLYYEPARAIEHALQLAAEGADIIDVGGESSRPGAVPVPARDERKRVLPVIEVLREKKDVLISVDTAKAEVAEAALAEGAHIVNDISAGRLDPKMLPVVARTGAGLVLMHMKGTPRTMQVNPHYQNVRSEVRAFLEQRLEVARAYGVDAESVVLDPGIGFGKRLEDNLALLRGLDGLAAPGRPVLVGASRKSFLGLLGGEKVPEKREAETIAANLVAARNGAAILRVHDVRAVKRAAQVADAILAGEAPAPPGERREPGYAQ